MDIATSDALTTTKVEQDRQFLIRQRNNIFSCSMAGIDVTLSRKEERKISQRTVVADYAEKTVKIAEQQKTIDNTFGTFFRNSCWAVFLSEMGEM